MLKILRQAVALYGVLAILTGLLYPLTVLAAGQALFPRAANGSLVYRNGIAVGSLLIGQHFQRPHYFWGRPSATVTPYDAAASTGSNLGPSNPALHTRVAERIAAQRAANPGTAAIPVDLVTASASGLDPHISIAAAHFQAARVARARGLAQDRIDALIKDTAERPLLPGSGEPRVNVLVLNLALDEMR